MMLSEGHNSAVYPGGEGVDDAPPKLSVVIVSWNTRELLQRCLASVYADLKGRDAAEYEVWVVDNASGDRTAEMVRRAFPQANLLANLENTGFARANNQAMAECRGQYILLLNPDTIVQLGCINDLVAFLDRNANAGAVGARLLNPDGSLQPSCSPIPRLGSEALRMLHLDDMFRTSYRMAEWSVQSPRRVDVVQGACMLLRAGALEQVGLLDEAYFIYSEEVDLCYRLSQAGWSIYWVPTAAVVHYGGQSTQQVAEAMFLRLYEAKILFFRKHYGEYTARAYKLILLMASLARLTAAPFAILHRSGQRERHMALAGNYRQLVAALRQM
jgi:N-acetylglucosaminyl-diphospho-decaprenol L-rhamnosyltransferase